MNTNFVSMWASIIISTIWQANENWIGSAIWFVIALVYAVIVIFEDSK